MDDFSDEAPVIAVKIGAPAIAALLCTKAAFGLIAKLIPQMNIMIVAFPIEIIVGLLFFGLTLQLLLGFMENSLTTLDKVLMGVMKNLR